MMKTNKNLKFYAIALCVLFSCSVMNAQKAKTKATTEEIKKSLISIVGDPQKEGSKVGFSIKEVVEVKEDPREDKPFATVEQMPQFKGGESALMKFIQENLTYPKDAQENGVQGRVVIRFVVNKVGKVVDATVIRGIDPSCDKEALRVINMMPDWMPGKQNGKNVSTYFTIPVIFKFTEKVKPTGSANAQKIETKTMTETIGILSSVVVSDDNEEESDIRVGVEDTREEKPFMMVEQMPQFKGGDSAMMKFIQENLIYPKDAQENGVQGRVIIRFVVNKVGKVVDAIVLRGIDPSCDKEALRVINMMPDWIPGKQNGKNVSTYFTIPLVFRFTAEEDQQEEVQSEENNTEIQAETK